MPELPWEKWYPTNWASEPGLRLCEAATRGIWFEAVNTMMLNQTDHVSGTMDQLAALCICRTSQMELAIAQLKEFGVAEITMQGDAYTMHCRRRIRDCNSSTLKRKAANARWSKHDASAMQNNHADDHAPSASAYAYASTSMGKGSGENLPTLEIAKRWLEDWRKNGADYSVSELSTAFLACSANGWMWGRNPVVDFRAALERQIQTDRQRQHKPINSASHPHWPPRREVELYAKEKDDDRGYWVSWYAFWEKKDFKRGEIPIDWKVELAKSIAKRRSSTEQDTRIAAQRVGAVINQMKEI